MAAAKCCGILTLLLVLGISIALCTISLSSNDDHSQSSTSGMKIFHCIIWILAIIYMLSIACCGYGIFKPVFSSGHGYHIMATYFMLITFGIVSILILINDIMPNSRCLNIVNGHIGATVSHLDNVTQRILTVLISGYRTTMVADSSMILTILLTMYLLISLKDHQATSCSGKGLVISMAASCISLYFQTFAQESRDNLNMKRTLDVELLMKELNSNDTKLHECLTKESILHEWDESTKQYFPCLIEFSVIAFSLVTHLWPSDDTTTDDHREESDDDDIGDKDTDHPAMKKNCLGLGVIFAINITMPWLYFQALFVLDKSLQNEFILAVRMVNTAYYTILLAVSAILFIYMICSCDKSNIVITFLKIENITLVVCGLAVGIFNICRVYAASVILNSGKSERNIGSVCEIDPGVLSEVPLISYMVEDLVDCVHIIIQTSIIIMSADSQRIFEGTSRRVQKPMLAFLAICNLTVWVDGSFIESSNASTFYCVNVEIMSSWKVISVIIYPFMLYFRIHSMSMILKIIDRLNARRMRPGNQIDTYQVRYTKYGAIDCTYLT